MSQQILMEINFNAIGLPTGKNVFLKVFYIDNSNTYKPLGETEILEGDPNPKWQKAFRMEYVFQRRQNLRLEVYDKGFFSTSQLGTCETTLSQIMTSINNNFKIPLEDKNNKQIGDIFGRVSTIASNVVQWQWSGKNVKNVELFSKTDSVLQLYYLYEENGKEIRVQIKETENLQNNINPQWARFDVSLALLCRNDLNRKFLLVVKDWGKKNYTYIGEQFADYLIGGQQINVVAAIDYTASNGEYTDNYSLHSQDFQKNQYLITLTNVCDLLLDYDNDKKIQMFGFGGVPKFPNYTRYDTENIFPLTGNPQSADVVGLDGVIQTYQQSLKNVVLCGPTLFADVLRKGLEISKQNSRQNPNSYTILLILTDGVIDDLEECKKILQSAGESAFSVIIVGIGNEKFSMMKDLDGPDTKRNNVRDCVNFIKFNDYINNTNGLLNEMLAEIPNQLKSFKKYNNNYQLIQQ
ncbi:hypothetical protein IMG5_205790 [Ichthyophthirius multifiliis]|uniref:Copine family protein n=1 Tax=Ichthyophthirius multifiliis TaxID=5932 RepID=G0R6K8_ICHMU|nr:hypothetical protein IMG5_205790 [Ichthyophthirius multifiliis]EGR26899.1 hypothetical protein IMG5_205790 [Ichthyophthirius multifiliis]|eukprot:XP_004023783.1 hypothetical protein IMG5_205790 [Ichthyophthirius multifiliis]